MFVASLSSLVDSSHSCVLSILNLLFLRRDSFLFIVVFDFNLCGPTLFGFSVGRTMDLFKSTLSNTSVFKSNWLKIHNQSLYFWSMNIQSLHDFGSSKGRKGGSIFVDFQREISWRCLIALSIWFCLQGDGGLVFLYLISLTFKP